MGSAAPSDDLLWHVEEACLNAHPAARELLVGGWLLRGAGGPTRRANSVNPLRHGPTDPTAIIEAAEQRYADLGQDALFRVPLFVSGMDAALARHGYEAEGETCTLFADLTLPLPRGEEAVDLAATPHAGWSAAWAALTGHPSDTRQAYQRSIDALLLPTAFACRSVAGAPVAVAYGALDRGLVVLESVLTHPLHRRHGHAGAIVRALLAWARSRGAVGACLQVAADNAAARALYRAEGFGHDLYRYHYRRKALAR